MQVPLVKATVVDLVVPRTENGTGNQLTVPYPVTETEIDDQPDNGGSEIEDVTEHERSSVPALLERFPECRIYRLNAGLERSGRVVAAACVVGEDDAAANADSMFPMMGQGEGGVRRATERTPL